MAPRVQVEGVPSDIALINGPMLLGNLFGYGLFGILIVQVFVYHNRFTRDPTWMKTLVYSVFFVDTVITALGTVAIWDGLAVGWGDLSTLVQLDWPFNALPALSGLVSSSVHMFFCWRIWKLQHTYVLPIAIFSLSIVQWAMAWYCGVVSVRIGVPRIGELRPFVIVWLGGSALVDVIITVTMVTILFRAGSKSAFSETNSVMAKLIKLTVETGMTTAIGALIELIFFFVFPTNNMHFIPFLMLAKLYSNTLLATLNSRVLFGDHRAFKPAALWEDDMSSGSTNRSGSKVPTGVVQITTTTERRRNDLEMHAIQVSNRDNSQDEVKKSNFIDFDTTRPVRI